MKDTLYRKTVTEKGRILYVPHVEADPRRLEIEQSQVVTLLSTMVMSMAMATKDQYPPHARVHRELQKLEEAVVNLTRLNKAPLEPELIDVGVAAWNAAIGTIQERLAI